MFFGRAIVVANSCDMFNVGAIVVVNSCDMLNVGELKEGAIQSMNPSVGV
jgi:hypothetical protein